MFDHPIPRVFQNRFSTQYRCFSVSMLAGPNDRSDVEKGGKSTCRSPVTRSPSRPRLQGPRPRSPHLRVDRIWSPHVCDSQPLPPPPAGPQPSAALGSPHLRVDRIWSPHGVTAPDAGRWGEGPVVITFPAEGRVVPAGQLCCDRPV